MTANELRVLDNLHKFERLEKDFLKFTYESRKPQNSEELSAFIEDAMRTAVEAFIARTAILEDFMNVSELNIQDGNALRLLDSIRRNDKFYSISFYENVVEKHNAKAESGADEIATSMHDILFYKFDDLLSDFHSWFDLTGYYSSKILIGPIISSCKVPSYLMSYFKELKETFAFRQYRASVALCRALLEMALYRKLKARGAFRDKNPKVTNINVSREDNLNCYINMAKHGKILSINSHDIAHGIRKTANEVLHPKDAEKQIDQKVVVDTIFATLRILEELYR